MGAIALRVHIWWPSAAGVNTYPTSHAIVIIKQQTTRLDTQIKYSLPLSFSFSPSLFLSPSLSPSISLSLSLSLDGGGRSSSYSVSTLLGSSITAGSGLEGSWFLYRLLLDFTRAASLLLLCSAKRILHDDQVDSLLGQGSLEVMSMSIAKQISELRDNNGMLYLSAE